MLIAVAQRMVAGGQMPVVLVAGHRLAREGGLVDPQLRHFVQAQVGGHQVARFQQHHVAGHQMLGLDALGHGRRAARWRAARPAVSGPASRDRPAIPGEIPIAALSTTMTTMASVSTKSPISPDSTAAASSTTIMNSRNWSATRCHQRRGAGSGRRLGPCRERRDAASAAVRPCAASTSRRAATSWAASRW